MDRLTPKMRLMMSSTIIVAQREARATGLKEHLELVELRAHYEGNLTLARRKRMPDRMFARMGEGSRQQFVRSGATMVLPC
jgi:hypothetical protein